MAHWPVTRSRPRGASTGAIGSGLEANTRAEQPKRTYVGAKGTGATLPQFTGGGRCQVLTPKGDASDTCTRVQYLPPSACRVLYTTKILAPELPTTVRTLMPHVYATVHVRRSQTTVRMPRVQLSTHTTVDYRSGDTCATAHVCHSTTDRTPRALATRGHTRPRVHCTRPTYNLRALSPVVILHSAYLHEKFPKTKPVYIKQHPL